MRVYKNGVHESSWQMENDKNNTKCHVGRKEQIEGVHINRKQQHSHGHKFDVTPVLQATFFE